MKVKLLTSAAVLLFVVLAIVLPGSLTTVQGQKGKSKVIELKAQKPTTRGEDPNIKGDKDTNDPNSDLAAPQQRGRQNSWWRLLRGTLRQSNQMVR